MCFFRIWSKTNVLFLECAFFEIWYIWNVSFLECDIHGKCHFWIVLFLECVFNWMWQKMECYKIDWDKVDLWMYNLLSFFIILWVEPSTFYVSNHLEKRLSMPLLGTVLFIYFCGNLFTAPGNKEENSREEFEIHRKKKPKPLECKTCKTH